MIRVLAICQEDPHNLLGGMGMHVRELYRAMARREDVEIDLLTAGSGEGVIEIDGYRKHQSDKLVCWKPRSPNLAALLSADLQLARTLTQLLAQGRRWDVVHTHEWNTIQIARMARDALQVPLVGTMHLCITRLAQVDAAPAGVPSECDLYLMQQEGNLVCDPSELILCSHAYVRQVRETFMTDRPINMIYNGIDRERWFRQAGDGDRARFQHGLPKERPLALYVGRIATMKGITSLLDAVEAEDNGYCVVVCGEVNANSEAEKEGWAVTKRLRSLEACYPWRFRWLGFRHGQELLDLYAAADVGLMPSIHEPFGIAALEHLAMGVPLISTEADGLGEVVVDGAEEFGIIIPARSSRAIVQALQLRRSLSDEQVEGMRREGYRRCQAFTWERAAEQTVKVYHQATGGDSCP
jgi:glycosyltransferase involved in cell wall biosynthesis